MSASNLKKRTQRDGTATRRRDPFPTVGTTGECALSGRTQRAQSLVASHHIPGMRASPVEERDGPGFGVTRSLAKMSCNAWAGAEN